MRARGVAIAAGMVAGAGALGAAAWLVVRDGEPRVAPPAVEAAATGSPAAAEPAAPVPLADAARVEAAPPPRLPDLHLTLLDAAGERTQERAVGWLARESLEAFYSRRMPPLLATSGRRFEFADGLARLELDERGPWSLLVVGERSGGARRGFLDLQPGQGAPDRLEGSASLSAPLALHRWRALDRDDRPLADARFSLVRDAELMHEAADEATSDANGWIEIVVACPEAPDELLAPMRLAQLAAGGDEPVAFALVTIDRPFAPGFHDHGVARFSRGDVVASGRVVDDRGEPLAGVPVDARAMRGARRGSGWRARVRSDDDGRFELRDVVVPPLVQLSIPPGDLDVTLAGLEPAAPLGIEVEPGTTGIELVLLRPASLVGRLVLPPGVAPVAVRLALVQQGAVVAPIELAADLSFALRTASFGRHRVAVMLAIDGSTALESEEFVLSAGESLAVPGLDPLDLTGVVRSATIEVRELGGGPLEGARILRRGDPVATRPQAGETPAGLAALLSRNVEQRRSDGGYAWIGESDAEGRCSVAFGARPPDLEVRAAGFRSADLERVDVDRTVELERLPGVVLELLDAAPELDVRCLRAYAAFGEHRWHGPADGPPQPLRSLVGAEVRADSRADGELRLPCDRAGTWTVSLFLTDGGSFGLGNYLIDVPSVEVEQRVPVTLEPALLDDALAASRAALSAR